VWTGHGSVSSAVLTVARGVDMRTWPGRYSQTAEGRARRSGAVSRGPVRAGRRVRSAVPIEGLDQRNWRTAMNEYTLDAQTSSESLLVFSLARSCSSPQAPLTTERFKVSSGTNKEPHTAFGQRVSRDDVTESVVKAARGRLLRHRAHPS